ncbi:hypothetical protein [Marinicella sp. W31]|uniref:hypothetical protein n=1 Tax=Marinicella sp. W31 TaxID=3023713 RepID=UPI003756C931
MKVKDLITHLEKYDSDSDVLCITEEEQLVPNGHLFRLLYIEEVDSIIAQKERAEDGVPSFRLGESEFSQKHVILRVVGEF